MNKLTKKIVLNILLIVAILAIIEFLSFLIIFCSISKGFFFENKYRDVQNWFSVKNMRMAEDYGTFRPASIPDNPSKRPIVILGCSYAYGTTLSDDETFSAQLSKYTNRSVYNLALQNMGTASALYLLEKPDIINKIPDAEYFIYLFIYDHVRRNYLNMPNVVYNYFGANYKLDKNGRLYFPKISKQKMFLESFYTNRLIQNFYANGKTSSGDLSLFKAILAQMKTVIDEKYPNSKLVLLVYDDEPEFADDGSLNLADDERLTKFCDEIGIKAVYVKQLPCGEDIVRRKYIVSDGWHPSKEAWQKIVPELSELLNLR